MTGIPKVYIPLGPRKDLYKGWVRQNGPKSIEQMNELEEKAAREAKWGREFQREENRKLMKVAFICFAAMGFMAWIVWG